MHVSLIGIVIFLTIIFMIRGQECPKDICPKNPPTVENGKIALTVFYDNDAEGSVDQRNSQKVAAVCGALTTFGDKLSAEFKVGASVKVVEYGIYCLNDCHQDILEACAYTLVKDFPALVCCNNSGWDVYKCAKDQNVEAKDIDDCVTNNKADKILEWNSTDREIADLQLCQLPDVLYNGRNDRCKKFTTSTELVKILCGMFKEAKMNLDQCKD